MLTYDYKWMGTCNNSTLYTIYFNIYTIIIKATILILIKRLSHFVLKKQKERVTDSDHRPLEKYDIKILDFD